MNSWTDSLSLCSLMLGGNFANFHSQSELDGFVDIPHFAWMVFLTQAFVCARTCVHFVSVSGERVARRLPVEIECEWGVNELYAPLSQRLALRCPWAIHWHPNCNRSALMWSCWSAPSGQLWSGQFKLGISCKMKNAQFHFLCIIHPTMKLIKSKVNIIIWIRTTQTFVCISQTALKINSYSLSLSTSHTKRAV